MIKISKFGIIIITLLLGVLFYCIQLQRKVYRQQRDIEDKTTIIHNNEKIIKNIRGENASLVSRINLSYMELKDAHKKHEEFRNEYEKKLAIAYEDINQYKRRIKNLESYISGEINATDTIYLEYPVEVSQKLKPINTKYLSLDFVYDENELTSVSYQYKARIFTVIQRDPRRKSNGKKHFPDWGILWGWEYNSITTIDDPNASVNNQISIKFK